MKKIVLLTLCLFSLTQYAQTELWGMTEKGGKYNGGVIFKTDGSGNNQTVEYDFYQVSASKPLFTNLIQASNGKLYGMSSEGGSNNYGALFLYDPVSNSCITKFSFDGTNGAEPVGSLIQASNGKLYGMASTGGVNFFGGVLFQFDPVTEVFTKLFDFDDVATGKKLFGSLVQAPDGNLYGMTAYGGSNGAGVIFQFNPVTNTFTKKMDFSGAADGALPFGSLTVADNGLLYGMTSSGGATNKGVLFQYNTSTNAYTKQLDFSSAGVSGGSPKGSLLSASDGKLYGLTVGGGVNNIGVLFQYDPATNNYIKKIDLDPITTGSSAESSLIQHPDGTIYGTTGSDGANSRGVLFQYDPITNICTNKHDFVDGNMRGTLMLAQDGNMYGMTYTGGIGNGTLFQYNPSTATFTEKIIFMESVNGVNPTGSLSKGTDGKLYGLTTMGGNYNKGVIFQYDPATHLYVKKHDFDETNGSAPLGSLLQAADGMFYGLTSSGGLGQGTIFKFDPATNNYVKLQDLVLEYYPTGSLIQATNGKLYGMTQRGGSNGYGAIFQYDLSIATYSVLYDFAFNTGGRPYGTLMQASDGMLYGVTSEGGMSDGVLFQFNPVTNTYTIKYHFGTVLNNGSKPYDGLIEVEPGKLYGLTSAYGVNDLGTIYQYDYINNVVNGQYSFGPLSDGVAPMSNVMKASDGNLYGMTKYGGQSTGVLYQYNPTTATYTKKFDFTGSNGRSPLYNNLIEISGVIGVKEYVNKKSILVYPNQSIGLFTIELKIKARVIITDVLGKNIYDQWLDAGKQKVDIQDQLNGVYFVNVQEVSGNTFTDKIIISK